MRYFWRVTDANTAAKYHRGNGFIAGEPHAVVTLNPSTPLEVEDTKMYILQHLNWRNRRPTPFISVYTDFETAENEALRRRKESKKDVVLWEICLDDEDDLEWGTMYKLKGDLGFWIQEYAFHNAKYEALIVHHIPRNFVVCGIRFTDVRGRKFTVFTIWRHWMT